MDTTISSFLIASSRVVPSRSLFTLPWAHQLLYGSPSSEGATPTSLPAGGDVEGEEGRNVVRLGCRLREALQCHLVQSMLLARPTDLAKGGEVGGVQTVDLEGKVLHVATYSTIK